MLCVVVTVEERLFSGEYMNRDFIVRYNDEDDDKDQWLLRGRQNEPASRRKSHSHFTMTLMVLHFAMLFFNSLSSITPMSVTCLIKL